MAFLNNLNIVLLKDQFEQCNGSRVEKLSGNRPASHSGKSLFDEANILCRLYNSDLVFSTFGLNWNHEVAPSPIDADIKLIDFNLPNAVNGRPEVILQTVGRKTKKGID